MRRFALAFMDLICSLKGRNDPLYVVPFSSVTSVGFSPFYAKAARAFRLIIWALCVANPAPSLLHRWRRRGLGRTGALSEVTQTWGVGARIWIPFSCDFTSYVALCSSWTWFPNMRFFHPPSPSPPPTSVPHSESWLWNKSLLTGSLDAVECPEKRGCFHFWNFWVHALYFMPEMMIYCLQFSYTWWII